MKKFIMTALAFGLASALWAASTTSFTYQAALRDEHGNVLTNGEAVARNFHVKLRLWNQPASGDLLWGRTFNVMTDEEGLFNLEVSDQGGALPDETPKYAGLKEAFLATNAGEIYVGLEVDGSTGEIVPRQRLLAVPYAAIADDVRGISGDIVADGNITVGSGDVMITPDGFSHSSGTSTFAGLVANGDVTVAGAIKANGGLTVSGGTVTVQTDVEIAKEKTLKANGGLAVEGVLSVGGSEVVPVPLYGIIMWTKKDLPDKEHWAVCDGKNNTPDLRDRFIVGAGSAYTYGDKGGEATHTLTANEMPPHSHTYYGDDQLDADGHTTRDSTQPGYDADSESGAGYPAGYFRTTEAGGGQSHENRPPYFALYYIMRIK